jgi:hypothetical protein
MCCILVESKYRSLLLMIPASREGDHLLFDLKDKVRRNRQSQSHFFAETRW